MSGLPAGHGSGAAAHGCIRAPWPPSRMTCPGCGPTPSEGSRPNGPGRGTPKGSSPPPEGQTNGSSGGGAGLGGISRCTSGAFGSVCSDR